MVAVNHVEPKDDGNMQARFFHRDVLVVVCLLGAHNVEHRTYLALGDQVVIGQIRGGGTSRKSGRILHQLPDLFVERHLLQQRLGTCVHVLGCKLRIGNRA